VRNVTSMVVSVSTELRVVPGQPQSLFESADLNFRNFS